MLHVLRTLHLLNHHNILLAHSWFLSRHMNPFFIVLVLLVQSAVRKNICCQLLWWWCWWCSTKFLSVIDFAADSEPFPYRPPNIVTDWRWNHRLDFRMMLRSSPHIRALAPQIWNPMTTSGPRPYISVLDPLIRPDNEEVRASLSPIYVLECPLSTGPANGPITANSRVRSTAN